METKYLVLEFLDSANKNVVISIKNPKDDLALEDVTDVMETIIDNDAILTTAGLHLTAVNKCYYKTITITNLEPGDGE